MASGKKAEQRNEDSYNAASTAASTAANAAIATAAQPDELEQRRRDQALKFDKWRTGESGPIDVRNMPGADVAMGLFNDSLSVHDANRVGRGYGSLSSNANPNYVAALDKENEMTRHLNASGALEANVDNAMGQNDMEMGRLGDIANQRNMGIAGLQSNRSESAADRLLRYQLRPKQPNFFRELAMNAARGAGGAAAAGGG